MSWTPDQVIKLQELYGKGNTASQIAKIIGGNLMRVWKAVETIADNPTS